MTNEPLIIGSFYWVIPVLDPDIDEDWEQGLQPARFAGYRADGSALWHCLNIEGACDWPMRWIGDQIKNERLENILQSAKVRTENEALAAKLRQQRAEKG